MAIIRSHQLIITLNINESKSPVNAHRKDKLYFRFDAPKAKATNEKIKWDHIKLKAFHQERKPSTKSKATYAVGENIYKSYI